MKKNKLYVIIAILTAVFLFATSALCNQCAAPTEDEKIDAEEEEEEAVVEETAEEETDEGAEEEEEVAEEEAEEEIEEEAEGEKAAPTIELEIYQDATYSESDSVCYYRIKAIVTGNPSPTVEFSKDDSLGAFGSKKVQVNLSDPSETYTLTATATNSEGTDTDSINLSWGCEEGLADDSDGIILEAPESEFTLTLTPSIVNLNPSDIGYIVYPSGINTETLIFGDSISNTDVRGYFAFDLSPIRGKTVKTMTLTLENPIEYGEPETFKGGIRLCAITSYLPLDADDYDSIPAPAGWHYRDPIIFEMGEDSIGFALLQSIVDAGGKLECSIKYQNDLSDGDFAKDGREYKRGNIILRILYTD